MRRGNFRKFLLTFALIFGGLSVARGQTNEVVLDTCDSGLRDMHPYVLSVTFSADSSKLLSTGGWDSKTNVVPGELAIWELATQKRQVFIRQNETIRNAAFSPDGSLIFWCDFGGVAHLTEVATGAALAKTPRRGSICNTVQFTPDGTLAYIGSFDSYIVIFDPKSKSSPTKLKAPDKMIATLAITRDGAYLGAATHEGHALIWDLATLEVVQSVTVNGDNPNGEGEAFAFSPDGKRFATGSYDGVLAIWNTENGQLLRKLSERGPGQYKVQFTEDGQRLYSANASGEITIWNVETGQVIKSAKVHDGKTYAMALSPDEKWLATGSFDRSLKLLNPTTLEVIETLIKSPPPID